MFPCINTVAHRNALWSFKWHIAKTSLADDLERKYGLILLREVIMPAEVHIKMSSYKVTGWHHINPVFCYVGNITLTLTVSKLRSVCKRTGAKNGLFTLPFTWTFQQLREHTAICESWNIRWYPLWFSELIQNGFNWFKLLSMRVYFLLQIYVVYPTT